MEVRCIMYAVIETGGKQYKAEKGALLKVERLPGETGKTVELKRVLLLSDGQTVTVGRPLVTGAKVVGEVIRQGRAAKVLAYHYRKRKHSEKIHGHRQYYTQLRILDILTA
jgi:large subunit ribosomal protein L21